MNSSTSTDASSAFRFHRVPPTPLNGLENSTESEAPVHTALWLSSCLSHLSHLHDPSPPVEAVRPSVSKEARSEPSEGSNVVETIPTEWVKANFPGDLENVPTGDTDLLPLPEHMHVSHPSVHGYQFMGGSASAFSRHPVLDSGHGSFPNMAQWPHEPLNAWALGRSTLEFQKVSSIPFFRPINVPSSSTSRQSGLGSNLSQYPALSPVLSSYSPQYFLGQWDHREQPAFPSTEYGPPDEVHWAASGVFSSRFFESIPDPMSGFHNPGIDPRILMKNPSTEVLQPQPGTSLSRPHETLDNSTTQASTAALPTLTGSSRIPQGPVPPLSLPAAATDTRRKKRKAASTSTSESNGDIPVELPIPRYLDELSAPILGTVVTSPVINNSSQRTTATGEITYYNPHDDRAVVIPPGTAVALYTDSGVVDDSSRFVCQYIDPAAKDPATKTKPCSEAFKAFQNWERHLTSYHVKKEYAALLCGELDAAETVALKHPRAIVQTVKCCFQWCHWHTKVGCRQDMAWQRHMLVHKRLGHSQEHPPQERPPGEGPRKKSRRGEPAT